MLRRLLPVTCIATILLSAQPLAEAIREAQHPRPGRQSGLDVLFVKDVVDNSVIAV